MMLFGQEVVWGALDRLWTMPIFILGIVAVWWGMYTYICRIELLTHARHRALLLPGVARWRAILKACVASIALAMLFLALLQPQWGSKDIEVMQEGRDVLIALDVSRSMLAQDIKPNRLGFAKLKIRKLLGKLSFERVGLILFSGNAFVQCPLTSDYKTFLMYLDQVTPEAISSGTTALGRAVERASEVFARSQGRKNKLLLLVTDGEDFASDISKVTGRIRDEKITVMAWGVGSEQGAPIPVLGAHGKQLGHQKDRSGELAITKLNPVLLRQISDELNGRYELLTLDDSDITRIVSYVQKFEREQFEGRTLNQYHDRYPILLAIAWVCLVLEWLL